MRKQWCSLHDAQLHMKRLKKNQNYYLTTKKCAKIRIGMCFFKSTFTSMLTYLISIMFYVLICSPVCSPLFLYHFSIIYFCLCNFLHYLAASLLIIIIISSYLIGRIWDIDKMIKEKVKSDINTLSISYQYTSADKDGTFHSTAKQPRFTAASLCAGWFILQIAANSGFPVFICPSRKQ